MVDDLIRAQVKADSSLVPDVSLVFDVRHGQRANKMTSERVRVNGHLQGIEIARYFHIAFSPLGLPAFVISVAEVAVIDEGNQAGRCRHYGARVSCYFFQNAVVYFRTCVQLILDFSNRIFR